MNGWRGALGGVRWGLLASLLLGAAAQSAIAGEEAAPAVLRLGFSASVFVGVNENDAKASMKVWTQAILAEHSVSVSEELQVLDGDKAIARAVRDASVDALTLTALEFGALGGQWMSSNTVVGINGGVATDEYLLLARADNGAKNLSELRGRTVIFFQNPRTCLAPIWFETILLEAGLGTTPQFCGRVIQVSKLSQSVLPVFFHQADACVVTRRGFETMVELNPQVGRQLKTVACSPPMVPVVFGFRAAYLGAAKDQIEAKIRGVNTTPAGRQVLTLFQCESLEVRPASVLKSSMDLLAAHGRLVAGRP